ncbi:MAG: hypothetical protein MUE85_07575 [Microscillaceae bacterium]|jgi:hypothetical protein|nr:hypothetical protein [Microscillaceae bacterium]
MYLTLLIVHSILRWLVLFGLILSVLRAGQALATQQKYTAWDNRLREASVGFSHLQFILGFVLYFLFSPLTKSYMANGTQDIYEIWFFGVYHIAMMFLAIMVLSIGSSIVKRKVGDRAKFMHTLIYFCLTLALLGLAVPWFRPWLRW